jgi:hypothetical protein
MDLQGRVQQLGVGIVFLIGSGLYVFLAREARDQHAKTQQDENKKVGINFAQGLVNLARKKVSEKK